ncbi:MAG: hypothetical protein ACC645_04135 [Pirellulales bacterium]
MPEIRSHGLQLGWRIVGSWLGEQASAIRRCRECGRRVTFLETTCPHCGAESPARIPLGALIAVAAISLVWVATVCMT